MSRAYAIASVPWFERPEARTELYYAKRPCAKMVEEAAAIWAEYLEKQRK